MWHSQVKSKATTSQQKQHISLSFVCIMQYANKVNSIWRLKAG